MTTFRRILVPTDLTERTVKALEVAAAVATREDARVTALHVIETIAGIEFEELASFYRKLEERADKQLQDIVARVQALHGRIDIAIVYGGRVEEVLQFARSHAIDLIVLASHPVDPTKPGTGLGTMSYKLAILASCPVLLVK